MLQNKIDSKKETVPRKGLIHGVVVAAAVVGLLTSLLIVGVLLKFYSDSEKKLSDRVADGLSSINYFYLSEKNINEFTQIVTEITAKELGEQCGGFNCYSWTAGNPTVGDLEAKFKDTLKGKITGFPEKVGAGGRIKFTPPSDVSISMSENNIKTGMKYHKLSAERGSFKVEAGMPDSQKLIIDKNIRYLLLAKIGQKLYGNGTYVRDWSKVYVNSGKFDCNNDGIAEKTISTKTQLSSRADLSGCKILDINFNVDDIEGGNSKWNSYATNCYNIANSSDAGAFAGKVENNRIYVQIDSLLEKSLICGIDGTDGLASVTDTYGQVSKSSSSGYPTCTEPEAGANAWQRADMQGKIQTILNALASFIEAGQTQIDVQTSAKIGSANSYRTSDSQSGWTVNCGSRKPGGCSCPSDTDPCRDIPQYCKIGDACGQQSSFSCKRSGECCGSCRKCGWTLYTGEGEIGYCCPAETPVFDSYTKTCLASSEENLKIEKVNRVPPPGSKTACDSCREWIYPNYGSDTGNPSCSWHNENIGTFCSWRSDYSCTYSGNPNSGSTTTSADYWWGGMSACGNQHRTLSRQQSWDSGIFSETRHDYWRSWKDESDYTSETYSCTLGAYFKFTFTPDISFKIVDTAQGKIVKKGTTDFEDLYFQVKFKPSSPYVIGG